MTNEPKTGPTSPPAGNRLAGLSAAKQALLEQRLRARKDASRASIPRRGGTGPAPLSFAQERLWLLDQMLPERMAYNVPRAMRLRGDLNVAALQKALDALVARHEILRTVYTATDGIPAQVVTPPRPVAVEKRDLAGLPEADREAELRRLLDREIERPFDLAHELMLRALLVRTAAREHVLLLMSHHIASDGWSKGILFRELGALYGAFHAGGSSALPELPIQYADFATWQRTWLSDHLGDHLQYWKEQLAGAPALLELPTDRPRPAEQSYHGVTLYENLPTSLLEGLRGLSQKEGTTLFMTLLAAFQVLLYRYTGQPDLLVGTPATGRNRVETEPLIGDFVNMLVLRTDLSGDPPFRELLRRVRSVALAAYEHGELPFEKLVAELQPARAASYSPLFQVMFALERASGVAPEFPGLQVELLKVNTPTAKHDFILVLVEDGEQIRMEPEYATDLFDEATTRRMLSHFEQLLRGIVADPDCRLSHLPLMTAPEWQQVVYDGNATTKDYPREKGIHHLFEAEAARRPQAPAVRFEDESLTYAELNARANGLAHHLRGRGVGPGDFVGLCVERSLNLVVGLLGIMKSGAAYVPLDPSLPRDRLGFMMEDAQVPILVTQDCLLADLPAHQAQVIRLDADWPVIARESPENLPDTPIGEQLAYAIFTSGSTGRPKGVMLPHRAVVNFLHHVHRRPGMTENDVHLGVATMSFDASVLDFYVPLTCGAGLAVVSRETTTDGRLLAGAMARHGVTVMHATPSTWRLLFEAGWQGDPQLKVLAGGEALPWELAVRLRERCASVWNLYGPTETAVYSAIHPVEIADGRVYVGRPIANTQIYVLDAHLQPVPPGVPGEVYIGGAGVAAGYLRRPTLTAEKFLPDPFAPALATRFYRTGDLGRFRPDGILECLGRTDHQVKIRGYRIELGEIEAGLRQHPAVREAVVVAREDVPGDRRLAAYVVPAPGQVLEPRALRGLVQEKLPDYMVPSAFVFLETLPLSPNGKVNRAALPRPDTTAGRTEQVYVPPATPVEEALADIWARSLGVEKVGAHDNFAELGGHSLLAVQIISRVRDAFQVDLPVRLVFEAPTLAEMAKAVEQALLDKTDPEEMASLLAELEALPEE